MPYLGPSKALLTTNDYSDWYGPGTIITDNPDQKPANWIYPEMYDPGVIWYWLNEDDCDKARKPESPIRSATGFCVQPRVSGCSFSDGTELVYVNSPRDCSRKNQAFVYSDNGVLIHKCSEKFVCPNGNADNLIGAKLVLSSKCTEDQATFLRTRAKSLKHGASGLCVHPQEGQAAVVQAGNECYGGDIADQTYDRYGPSNDCSGGLGGDWANDVYQFTGCNITLSERKGVFQSPGFPGKYPDGQLCSWTLRVPANHSVLVHFTHFSLDVESGNDTDVVELYRPINDSFQLSLLISNQGHEFIIGFSAQHDQFQLSGTNRIYLTSDTMATIHLHVPALPLNTTIKLTPGIPRHVDLPVMGFLGLPVSALGTDYVISTVNPVLSSVLLIVSTKDNTRVNIKLKITNGGEISFNNVQYSNGDILVVVLDALEGFQVVSQSMEDITGTRVTSDKPVSVYSGCDCAYVPMHKPSCDHLVEQLPPVNLLGTQFVTMATANRTGGDIYHVVAAYDGTVVTVDNNVVTTVQAGQRYELDSRVQRVARGVY
ncbi:hypothetical protein QZH41_000998 [Actinostola sp. cb2023]|nr:hypothetical protein QZH41_000998 [Actinostola sp. cb2023]